MDKSVRSDTFYCAKKISGIHSDRIQIGELSAGAERRRQDMIYLFLIAGIAGGDLALKCWVEKQDPKEFPRELEKSGGKIWLYRNHNAGFPFGFLKKYQQVVRLIPLSIISGLFGVLLYLFPKRGTQAQVQKLGLSILLGGALSNLYDRMVRHYVVDYFSIRIGFLRKVVFNLGDLAVFLGSGILGVFGLCLDVREAFAKKTAVVKAASITAAAAKTALSKQKEGISAVEFGKIGKNRRAVGEFSLRFLRSFLKRHSR